MRRYIALSLLFLLNQVFASQSQKLLFTHPIIGTWSFRLPSNGCVETYEFKSDGTDYVTSSEEEANGVYEISGAPSPLGFYKLTDTIAKDNGKKDCSGEVMELGNTATSFIKFHPSGKMMVMCQTEALDQCFGPLIKKEVIVSEPKG